jgi:hypothetical protein
MNINIPTPAKQELAPNQTPSSTELVHRELSAMYKSIAEIAMNTGLTAAEVLDALAILERRHGTGRYIDVSSRNNCSVRLRPEALQRACRPAAE